jgi:pimeloyl-ACP methyl ester carboxylesterase
MAIFTILTFLVMIFLCDGRKINYSESGVGAPVILIHGYLETSAIWDGFFEKLAVNHRVIAVDLPGHGLSESLDTTHTMEFMASVVKKLLDSLGIKKAFLIGHSMGGYVTLAFLDLFPSYLAGYSLFHSQPFPDTEEAIEKRKREISLAQNGNKELIYPENITRMFAARNLSMLPEEVLRSMEIASEISAEGIISVLNGMMLRPSRLSCMEESRIPFLWILGAEDNYITLSNMRERVCLPENAKLVVLENSGHMGFIEEEDKSLHVVNEFITRYSENLTS